MKRILIVVFVLVLLLLVLSRFDVFPKQMSEEEKRAAAYVESRGYHIEERLGKTFTYILDKSLLNSESAASTGNLPYIQTWGVQESDPGDYFGKEIATYGFTVSGHPLSEHYNTDTRVAIMMADGEVIGGTSIPKPGLVGSPYSLDGRTLEEITGISFAEWKEQWAQKYNE
ncbi:hypothetical protein [Paenibacillus dakarensis]|uniref:hypothetical protein n=1 Tax=Paenibacillus dakarensis TaxID=1527293 RepID=UPI0006D52E31|nr:hypothetical protein [Paenibacillus dakarensis]